MDRYESAEASISRVADTSGAAHIGCLHLGSGGVLGDHPAASNQLFCVVAGEGEVSGGDGTAVSIRSGQAAFWEAGERHETTTRTGLTAIIIEVAAVHL